MSIAGCSSPGADALQSSYTRSERACADHQKYGVFAPQPESDGAKTSEPSKPEGTHRLQSGLDLRL